MSDILEWKDSHPIRYVEPITPLVVADVLERAAFLVQKRGWCTRALIDPEGRVCASGAILEAIGGLTAIRDDPWLMLTRDRTIEMVVQRVGDVRDYRSLPYWNDTEKPGAEGVARVFLELAATLRREEER